MSIWCTSLVVDVLFVSLDHRLVAVSEHTLDTSFTTETTLLHAIEVRFWHGLLKAVDPALIFKSASLLSDERGEDICQPQEIPNSRMWV